MTLDGYIAAEDGSFAFLDAFNDMGTDFGFQAFYDTVDTVLMGYDTYTIVRKLQAEAWVYAGKPSYVCTRRLQLPTDADVTFLGADALQQVAAIKQQHAKTWLVGGGVLATALWQAGLLDEILFHVMPTVLGTGIPAIAPGAPKDHLQLIGSETYIGGVVSLHYKVGQGSGGA